MPVIDELVKANAEFAKDFKHGHLTMPPTRRVAIVTCMDARLQPARFLGLEPGDAHVIRNAGGRVRDAVRSLIISQQLLGTREVAVIHHTDCGMLTFTDESLRDKVRQELGTDTGEFEFLPFEDLEQSVRDDVAFLKNSPFIPKDVPVRGFVYDVRTGRLTEIKD